jgi:hypothetical protein
MRSAISAIRPQAGIFTPAREGQIVAEDHEEFIKQLPSRYQFVLNPCINLRWNQSFQDTGGGTINPWPKEESSYSLGRRKSTTPITKFHHTTMATKDKQAVNNTVVVLAGCHGGQQAEASNPGRRPGKELC